MSYWKGDHTCDNQSCRNAKDTSLHADAYISYCDNCKSALKRENKCENCGLEPREGGRLGDESWCASCNAGYARMHGRISEQEDAMYKWDSQRYKIANESPLLSTCQQIPVLSGVASLLMQRKRNKLEEEIAAEEKLMNERHTKEYLLAEKAQDTARAKLDNQRQYKLVRKEIESMPRYQTWRNEILQKHGRRCSVCGDTENIEVDHYPESMYKIVLRSGIMSLDDHEERLVRAYEFLPFWDLNNGAPLCRKHHSMTSSSQTYQQLKSE